MTHALDPGELLYVEMHHLARLAPFVADRRDLRFEGGETPQTMTPIDRAYRRERQLQALGNRLVRPALPPQSQDVVLALPGRLRGRVVRPRAPIGEASHALGPIAADPDARRARLRRSIST